MKLAKRNEPAYYLRLTDEAVEEGPFPIEELREKAQAGEVSKETWFRREGAENYRQLGEDGPLAADLWPEEEAFDPEASAAAVEPATSGAGTEESVQNDGDVSGLLQGNVDRDRAARTASGAPETGFDWQGLLAFKWMAIRWLLAVGFVAMGVYVWRTGGEGNILAFIVGFVCIAFAIFLTAFDITRLLTSPIASLTDTLFEGSGGGKQADYWTADALLAQGEYKLAAAEYRRIVLEHPREVQAYLKGIRAARAADNQKEADRFHEMALKNLTTDQDRNLFLNSVGRMG